MSHAPLHGQTLERIGADKVINPEQDAGVRLAHSLFNPDIQDYLSISSNFGISRFRQPDRMIGQTIEEAGLGGTRDRYGISVLAVRRAREPILFPSKDEVIQRGDILFIAGRDDLLDKVRRGETPQARAGTPTRSA
jgi:trk system potassium uptake protein